MGYVLTGGILLVAAVAVIAIYELFPDHIRDSIDHFIDELGGVK